MLRPGKGLLEGAVAACPSTRTQKEDAVIRVRPLLAG